MLRKTVIRHEGHKKKIKNRDLHPVLDRVIGNRNCQYIEYELEDLLRPQALKNIEITTDELIRYRREQKNILIIGDYDCDGATASTVAIKGLRALGFTNVDYLIPNRFKSGYGLSLNIVKQALERKDKPEVLITVDNGITSIEGVDYAISKGLKVIITDHHLPGNHLPNTPTIINPQLPGDQFQSKATAGVGVIFYVLLALRQKMREQGMFEKAAPNFMQFLDLVALGTIADCVPFDKNNRILISHGLRKIREGRMSIGLEALLSDEKSKLADITTTDIAFKVAPKLNAVGRMDDMTVGVRCLLSESEGEAEELANILKNHNTTRKLKQNEIQTDALRKMAKSDKHGIVLYDKSWHQGIIGIVASKIKEEKYRPCIIFAEDDDGYIKGSGRSIEGINLRDTLAKISEKNNILKKFGGHSMAAGMSILKKDLETFSAMFDAEIKQYDEALFTPVLYTDGVLKNEEMNTETAKAIDAYGIWGQGYEEPIFEKKMTVISKRLIKEKHIKLTLSTGEKMKVNAMWFFCTEKDYNNIETNEDYQVYFKLNVSEYLGEEQFSIFIEHMDCVGSDIKAN
ncbi:MAG: single-stranded-DNA-specific exonuclease RecJ [Pseudomonadota bacterium]|nr:single-stranded-DNA-specific exonuclease RecJ [Pseudomonadota bacterium]